MASKKVEVGRPPKFRSKKQMQQKIDEYFKKCEGEPVINKNGTVLFDKNGNPVIIGKRPPTMSGLALALGFQSRQSLLNYEAKPEFMDTIMRARARVEQYAEESLFDKNTANGAKFSLANNFAGWKERADIEYGPKEKLEDLI